VATRDAAELLHQAAHQGRTIVTAVEDDPLDANHRVLKENLRRLRLLRDASGMPYDLVTIPMPKRVERDGQRLPATYLNFLFVNGALLVPTFGDRRTERPVLKALQQLMAEKAVKSKAVNVCAPGFHVFSKFVKLPPVDAGKVTQIIQYEAQQNVPFPL